MSSLRTSRTGVSRRAGQVHLRLPACLGTSRAAGARALSIWSATSGSAGALGLMLCEVIRSALGWRWTLLINVPIGVALWVVASVTLVPPRVLDRRSLRTEPAPQRRSSSQLTTVPVIDPLAAPIVAATIASAGRPDRSGATTTVQSHTRRVKRAAISRRLAAGYCTALLRKRSSSDTGRRVPAALSSETTSCVRRSSRSASTNAKSATIAVARRSCRARRPWTSSARHLIIRTGEFALAVAVREADGTNSESSPRTDPGPSTARIRPCLRTSTLPSRMAATPFCWVALFEERRASCRVAHRDLSVELVHVLVNDKSKRAHGSNRCWSLRIQARSP